MKTYNTKKKITIVALSLAAVILAGGLWVYVDSLGNNEPPSVTAGNTGEQETGVDVKDIKIPDSTTQDKQGSGTDKPDDMIITDTPPVTSSGASGQDKPSDGKPKTAAEATPPATPEPAPKDEHEITGTDNPNVPPSSTPKPAQPETSTPQSGDKKDGKIYIPGFGWVEDEGGGVEVQEGDFELSGEIVGE